MTGCKWPSDNPLDMIDALRGEGRARKLRLFAVTCCRRAWEAYRKPGESPEVHPAILVSERFADGLAGKKQLRAERSRLGPAGSSSTRASMFKALSAVIDRGAADAAQWTAWHAAEYFAYRQVETEDFAHLKVETDLLDIPEAHKAFLSGRRAEEQVQVSLLCEIIGNPFHHPRFELSALSPTVRAFAHAIDVERAFDRMPILGDALEEAGYDRPDILSHCRGPSPHVRGCWVVDLLLGKG